MSIIQHMTDLLTSVNARGLNILHAFSKMFVHEKKVDFAMVQKSHILRKDAGHFVNKFNHPIVFLSAPMRAKGKRHDSRQFDLLDCWVDSDGRIAIAKIQSDGQNIAFISAYSPDHFDAGFCDLLTKTLLDLTGLRLVLGVSNIAKMGEAENSDQRLASAADTGMIGISQLMNPSVKDYIFFLGDTEMAL